MISRAVWVIVLLLATAASVHGDGRRLAVESHVVPSEVALGEPLQLTVSLRNVGDESLLLLARDANFVVEVASAARIDTVRSPRFTRRDPGFKDDEVPLRPGDAYTRLLPIQLNDLRATLGEGWVATPGAYQIRVRYDSEGSVQDRSALVWRGSSTADWSDIRVRSPDEGERARRLNDIERCLTSEECDAVEVANFFRVVRDERSPDFLLRLIEARPYNIWILDAMVFQGRASDAERLRQIAVKVDDVAIRQVFIAAAIKLEQQATHSTGTATRPKLIKACLQAGPHRAFLQNGF